MALRMMTSIDDPRAFRARSPLHRPATPRTRTLPSARETRRQTQILAAIFALGEPLDKPSYRAPLKLRFEHGMIRAGVRGYRVTCDRHPGNPRAINVNVPPAISGELLRLHALGVELDAWRDSTTSTCAYQSYLFRRTGGQEITVHYDHVIDRAVEEPEVRLRVLAKLHDLGTLRACHLEGARDASAYRRVLEFEHGALIIDRDRPDALQIIPLASATPEPAPATSSTES